MNSMYVMGGQQPYERPLRAGANDWYKYEKGLIMQVFPETGEVKQVYEYVSPPEVVAEPNQEPAILFKSGTMVGNTIYACTQTEIMIFELPGFKRVKYITLPRFNDLHHVRPTPNGTLLVANTGLDMALEMTMDGEIVNEWNTLGEDPWGRFSRDIDYRKISTKPHASHPNHVFILGEEFWATRFQQKDAISLVDPSRRIALNVERVHDGVPHNGKIYFTSVDGHVLIADQQTLKVEEDIDLNTMAEENSILGWCRSILIDGDKIWVGFSRLRPTKFRENVSWVKNGFKRSLPTHVACYDLTRRECVKEVDMEQHGLNAVFSIFPGE